MGPLASRLARLTRRERAVLAAVWALGVTALWLAVLLKLEHGTFELAVTEGIVTDDNAEDFAAGYAHGFLPGIILGVIVLGFFRRLVRAWNIWRDCDCPEHVCEVQS